MTNIEKLLKTHKMYYMGSAGGLQRLDKASQMLVNIILIYFRDMGGAKTYTELNKDRKQIRPLNMVLPEDSHYMIDALTGNRTDNVVIYLNRTKKPLVRICKVEPEKPMKQPTKYVTALIAAASILGGVLIYIFAYTYVKDLLKWIAGLFN